MASGNGFLCHCLGLKDALLYNEFGGLLGMLVDVLHACRLTLEKFLDCLGVLVKKLIAHDGDAGDELAGITGLLGNLIPGIREIDGGGEGLIFGEGCGCKGLRQHADSRRVRGKNAYDLGGLAFELECDTAGDARGVKQVIHHVFRRGSLAGEVDGLACKVFERGDGRVCRDHAKNAERIDVQAGDTAFGLVVHNRCRVCGNERDVGIAFDKGGEHFVCSRGEGERIAVGKTAVLGCGLVHKVHETDGGGTLERGDAYAGGRVARSRACCGAFGPGGSALGSATGECDAHDAEPRCGQKAAPANHHAAIKCVRFHFEPFQDLMQGGHFCLQCPMFKI